MSRAISWTNSRRVQPLPTFGEEVAGENVASDAVLASIASCSSKKDDCIWVDLGYGVAKTSLRNVSRDRNLFDHVLDSLGMRRARKMLDTVAATIERMGDSERLR